MLLLKCCLCMSLLFLKVINALIDPSHPALTKDAFNIIKVTEDNYPILSQGVDGYYNILFLTMRTKKGTNYDCQICIDFEPVYRKVAAAVQAQAPQYKVLFYIADVSEVPSLVQDLKLTNVPHVVTYSPPDTNSDFSWSKSPFYHYQLSNQSVKDILHFGNFVGKMLQIYIQLDEDFNTLGFFGYFTFFVGVFLFIKKVVLPNIDNKWKVGLYLLSLFIILNSISGYKFTQINNIPLLARDDEGKIMYFSGGNSWQFGIEIFSVSGMYIIMGFFTLLLIWVNTWSFLDDRKKTVLSSIFACCVFYTFSYYISCYKIKEPFYPF